MAVLTKSLSRYWEVGTSFCSLTLEQRTNGNQNSIAAICLQRVVISNILEDNATDEQKTKGLDIADFLLMTETPQMALQRLIKQHPPLQHLIDSLGLVLVEES